MSAALSFGRSGQSRYGSSTSNALRVTLRAARSAAETTSMLTFAALLPLSLFLMVALFFTRRLGFFSWRMGKLPALGMPAGRALLVLYVLWIMVLDRGITKRVSMPYSL